MITDNYNLLRMCIGDIETYVKEMVEYIDNQREYDNCEWYDQDEVKAYFKSVPETIEEVYGIIDEIEEEYDKQKKYY